MPDMDGTPPRLRPRHRTRGRQPDPERTAQTRELILGVALAQFLQTGFERTRMAEIAARAGLAKGTLYLHFADKEALFEFVLEQLVSAPLARLRAQPAPPGERTRAQLERLFLPMLRDFEASGRAAVRASSSPRAAASPPWPRSTAAS